MESSIQHPPPSSPEPIPSEMATSTPETISTEPSMALESIPTQPPEKSIKASGETIFGMEKAPTQLATRTKSELWGDGKEDC